MIDQELIKELEVSFNLSIEKISSKEDLHNKISSFINDLINHDFEKLIYYLYRIDVDEKKMRNILDKNEGENTAELIADLIIERQLQKIESRKKFKSDEEIDESEKW